MSSYDANLSHDGYTYTEKEGLIGGLPTYGVVHPESNIRNADDSTTWDAVVIGAGYSGLVAARDLVKAGKFRQRVGESGICSKGR